MIQKRNVPKFNNNEIIVVLRAYLAHPSSWPNVIAEVRRNGTMLGERTKVMYASSTLRQMRERISTKIHALMTRNPDTIVNEQIGYLSCFITDRQDQLKFSPN